MIRPITLNDTEQICDIYNYYIKNTIITFEEDIVSNNEMKKRIEEVICSFPWLVSEEKNEITGYAYLHPWKNRSAYKYSIESSVYIRNGHHGKGIGTNLYKELFKIIEEREIHAIIAGIALPNERSIRLHEKFGFKKVAHLKEVGFKFNKWIDVGYWELLINLSCKL